MRPEVQPAVLSVREAARFLNISPRTLWNLTTPRGPIPCIRLGTGKRPRVLYPLEVLRTWLHQQVQQAQTKVDTAKMAEDVR